MIRQVLLVTDDLQSISPRAPEQYALRALPFSDTWENEEVFESPPRFLDRFILKRRIFKGKNRLIKEKGAYRWANFFPSPVATPGSQKATGRLFG